MSMWKAITSAWRWLITMPAPVYPNPPVPRDENSAGIGWAGDRKIYRPWGTPVGQPARRSDK